MSQEFGPLAPGVYLPSPAFQAIREHRAVMRPDGSLVAVVGPTNDPETERWLGLFIAAPELLGAWREFMEAHELLERNPLDHKARDRQAKALQRAQLALELTR